MKRIACSALSALFLATCVHAEEPKNFKNELIPVPAFKQNYIALGGGGSFPMQNSSSTDDSDVWILGSNPPGQAFFFALNDVNWNNNYQNGYELNLALGHRFTPFWAAELEGVYDRMQRNIDGTFAWTISDFPTGANENAVPGLLLQDTSSDVNFYTVFANALFNYANRTAWTPFLGVGLGAGFYNSAGTDTKGGFTVVDRGVSYTTPTREFSPSITGTVFAWQFKAGISYDINETVALVLQYRLIGTTQLSATSSQINTNPNRSLTETAFFNVPVNNVKGMLVNGLDLNIRFNV